VPAVYAANQVVEVTTPDVEETKVSAMFPFEPGGKFNSANVETKETSDEFSDVTQPLVKEEPNATYPNEVFHKKNEDLEKPRKGNSKDDTNEEEPKDTHRKLFDVDPNESDDPIRPSSPFDPGIPTDIDGCQRFPFDSGSSEDKTVVFKGKETLDEPKDNEAMVEDEKYSENLVFGAKAQNFQPELGSGVVYYSRIFHLRCSPFQPASHN
jgi:hypothetical protein